MKKLIACLAGVLCAAAVFAQKPELGQMDKNGQSGPSEEARYVLGLVRNGDAKRLNAYFDNAPWKIQTEIDAYTDADHNATVAVFCVAVDLGNVDVVKAFVDHGYGPADLCRVQHFTTKRIVVSRADLLMSGSASSHSSSSSLSWGGWFGGASSSSSSASAEIYGKYSNITYGEKKIIKTYFANPLDFAGGEMFDYLWSKGFRSNNLFTKQALAQAKRLNRMDIWQYIMDNKPEVLADKSSYISEAAYKELLEAAKAGPDTLAYEVLEKQVLGKVSTSEQAKQVRAKLSKALQDKLAQKGGGLQPADTLGYSRMDRSLEAKETQLRLAEENTARARAAAARQKAEAARQEAEAARQKAEAEAERERIEAEIIEQNKKVVDLLKPYIASIQSSRGLGNYTVPPLGGISKLGSWYVYRASGCDIIVEHHGVEEKIKTKADIFYVEVNITNRYGPYMDSVWEAKDKNGNVIKWGGDKPKCYKTSYFGRSKEEVPWIKIASSED